MRWAKDHEGVFLSGGGAGMPNLSGISLAGGNASSLVLEGADYLARGR